MRDAWLMLERAGRGGLWAMKTSMTARDIMQRDVVTVPEDMGIWDMARLFVETGVTGAPVVSRTGELAGVVSQTDIARYLKDVAFPPERKGFYDEAEPDLAGRRLPEVKARSLMNRKVVEAEETASAEELSEIMLRQRVHRVIITRERRLVGIVTTMDLLRVL